MKGYKAFKKGLICDPTGKNPCQYEENSVKEFEGEARICNYGAHFCKDPLAVLDYYPLVDNNGEMSEFAEVEALDEPVTDDGQKYCSTKLKIGAKISFAQLVQASVNFDLESVKESKVKTTSKNSAQIGSSGDSAKIGSSGNYAQINSTGKYAVICCAGNKSIAKGKIGSWLTLSEWEYSEKEKAFIPICVKTEKIDGNRIKEDTFYKLEKGEFVEIKEN